MTLFLIIYEIQMKAFRWKDIDEEDGLITLAYSFAQGFTNDQMHEVITAMENMNKDLLPGMLKISTEKNLYRLKYV